MSDAPPGYTSVPCGSLDLANNEKLATVTVTFLFGHRFDLVRLQDAYYELLRAWPFLAARLRKGRKHPELWRLQVPDRETVEGLIAFDQAGAFTKSRPPMFSCLDSSNEDIETVMPIIGLAKHVKAEPPKTPVTCDVDRKVLLKYGTHPYTAKSNNDYFTRDANILPVHVNNFRNGAAWSLTFPHVCFDAAGIKVVLTAYTNLLRGDTVAALPPLGYDPFAQLKPSNAKHGAVDDSTAVSQKQSAPPAPSPWSIVSLAGLLVLAFYFAFDLLWDRPDRQMRRVAFYLPPAAIAELKAQARADLEREIGGRASDVRISTGNVITAWIIKNDLVRRSQVAPNRSVVLATLADMRFARPNGVKEIAPNYLSNCLIPIPTDPRPASELNEMSLGSLALMLRQAIDRTRNPAELEKFVRWQVWRSTPIEEGGGHRAGEMAFFFPPSAYFTIVTDWSAFKLYDFDFSPAFENGGSDDGASKDILNILTDAHVAVHHRNAWTVAGGRDGGTWVIGYISNAERRHPAGWGRYADAESVLKSS
ncbi:hypothetical protein OC845_001950 [Tilletia horrida]|nr:hypothetical protein OC845_001950 [Tilletia horrida]